MNPRSIFIIFALIPIFQTSILSQNLKTKQILEESKADLVIVGRIEGFSRTFNNNPSDYSDSTFAYFQVLRTLKGEYKEKYIEVRFPGHLAFSLRPYTILFITTDMKAVVGDGKLGNCLESSCYYSIFDWTLTNTKKNITAVENLLRERNQVFN